MRQKTKYIVLTAAMLMIINSMASGISLTDYVFPDSRTQEAYLNGAYTFNGLSSDSSQVGYNMAGSYSYDLFYRSLPFAYQLNALGNFSMVRDIMEDAEGQEAYSVLINTRASSYFRDESKFFGFGEANLGYRNLLTSDKADDPYLDVLVGVGYGRQIDATVLKLAVRMVNEFKKYGIVKQSVPDRALLDLARVIDRESEFRAQYGAVEYQKYWYEEMEQVLISHGVLLTDNIGAIGAIRIQEVMDEPTGRRFHGWDVRVGVGYVISDYTGGTGDPALTAAFNWSRPVSMMLQLNNNAYLRTVLSDNQTYNIGNTFQVYYEMTNRIDWDNSFNFDYTIPTADGAENTLMFNFSSTYILYIANQLTFNPGFNYNYSDDGLNDPRWDWAVLGSISYRLR